jgi:hypothetical protein
MQHRGLVGLEFEMSIWLALSLAGVLSAGLDGPATSGVLAFAGAADVSAAVAIDAESIAVADNEDSVLRIYAVTGGPPKATFDMTAFLSLDSAFPQSDIEAAARVGDRIYWMGSHGRNKDGKFRPNRCRFFATEIQRDDKVVSLKPVGRPYTTLLSQLVGAKSLKGLGLREAAGVDQVKNKDRKRLAPKDEGLNIEGLCSSADGKQLLIGFRNPIPKGKALVVPLENPAEVVEQGRPAVLGKPLLWNLGGLGIRDMTYVEGPGAYFIIAGPNHEGKRFALYRWSGKTEDQPVKVRPDLGAEYPHFTPEGLVGFWPQAKLLVLSDDGTRVIRVAGPEECKEGQFIPGGKCLNKFLLDTAKKTFRGLWVSAR